VANTTSNTNAGAVPVFQVPMTTVNGLQSGVAVWEVVQEPNNTGDLASLDFGVFFQFTTSATAPIPAGTGVVGLSYAPTPNTGGLVPGLITTANALGVALNGPIPRFLDTSLSHEGNIVTITACTTTLLFPYTTNIAGFETGMSIANTSADIFGTVAQTGTCTLTFFGINVGGTNKTFTVAPFTTPAIPAGGVWADTLSDIAHVPPAEGQPGGGMEFQGYIFAQCGFQFAHGFAFISDASATQLAEGYLALVVQPVNQGLTGTLTSSTGAITLSYPTAPLRGSSTLGTPAVGEGLVH